MDCTKCEFCKGYVRQDFIYVRCYYWGVIDLRVLDDLDMAVICPVEDGKHLTRVK